MSKPISSSGNEVSVGLWPSDVKAVHLPATPPTHTPMFLENVPTARRGPRHLLLVPRAAANCLHPYLLTALANAGIFKYLCPHGSSGSPADSRSRARRLGRTTSCSARQVHLLLHFVITACWAASVVRQPVETASPLSARAPIPAPRASASRRELRIAQAANGLGFRVNLVPCGETFPCQQAPRPEARYVPHQAPPHCMEEALLSAAWRGLHVQYKETTVSLL